MCKATRYHSLSPRGSALSSKSTSSWGQLSTMHAIPSSSKAFQFLVQLCNKKHWTDTWNLKLFTILVGEITTTNDQLMTISNLQVFFYTTTDHLNVILIIRPIFDGSQLLSPASIPSSSSLLDAAKCWVSLRGVDAAGPRKRNEGTVPSQSIRQTWRPTRGKEVEAKEVQSNINIVYMCMTCIHDILTSYLLRCLD